MDQLVGRRQALSVIRVTSAKITDRFRRLAGNAVATIMVSTMMIGILITAHATNADAASRSLKLYYLHTGERATITYKRNGKFLPAGLKKLNHFLRDWRRNEPTRMDPNLFDLIWEVYRESGSKKHVHIISAYRSQATNTMLRKRGRGVAKKSQHTLGKAMDFFLPDVKLAKLRKLGLVKQVGGVGYYPRSGSPFVHMDTGRVRHWPRMTRKELVRVFPHGKTLHVPTDGKPLPGYNQAVAAFNARSSKTKKIVLATGDEKKKTSFFQRLARIGREDRDDDEGVSTPAPRAVKTTVAKAVEPPSDIPQNPEPTPAPTTPALPKIATIPVPRRAPRGETLIAQNEETQLAGLEQPDQSSAQTTNEATALDETVEEQQVANIPVPIARPAIEENAPVQPDLSNQPILAQLDPDQGLPDIAATLGIDETTPTATKLNGVKVAGDTASKLREQLFAQARNQVSTIGNPPRPSESVGSQFTTALLDESENSVSQNPVTEPLGQPIVADSVERKTLEPIEGLNASDGSIAVPQPNPSTPQANEPLDTILTANGATPVPTVNPLREEAVQVASVEPIEPELKNDGVIPVPSQNPAERAIAQLTDDNAATIIPLRRPVLDNDQPTIEVALVDPESGNLRDQQIDQKTGIDGLIAREDGAVETAANIIPVRAPRTIEEAIEDNSEDRIEDNIELAAIDEEEINTEFAALTSAPKALDVLSMSWYEQQVTGAYVLSTDTTVRKVAKLRAPAYGRAAIRQAPKLVLTAGFVQADYQGRSGSFTGNAVSFQPFAKFN